MKRAVTYTYTFDPSANTLDLSAFPGFDIKHLFAVLDLDAGSILYAAGTPGYGYTALDGAVLTLMAPMTGASAFDHLMVIYDDGDQVSSAGFVTLIQGSGAVTSVNRLPVEVDAQSSGLAQDETVEAAVTALGFIGSGPPSLPASSTGVLGLLRAILVQGLISIGGAANGAPVSEATDLIAGSDGTNVRTLLTDGMGSLMTGDCANLTMDITSQATIKATGGRVGKVAVLVGGSATGTVNNVTDVGGASTANAVYVIPTTVGNYTIGMPCPAGIGIVPGTGQTLALSWD